MWFKTLFGFIEQEFSYKLVQAKFSVSNDTLTSLVNGKSYKIGAFENMSLGQLRKEAELHGIKGSVTVSHIASSDIFDLHLLAENKHALFQAASQFNSLEFPGPNQVPENGVSGYEYDGTQGPACALAAAPGTVYRNYLTSCNGFTGQTAENQLNNLDDFQKLLGDDRKQEYFQVRNGYVTSTSKGLSALTAKLKELPQNHLLESIKVGIHWNVEAPFSSRYQLSTNTEPQIVSQAYCSAISCGYNHGININEWAPLAILVLKAAYESTLLAAILNYSKTGCKKVFLTFLGGGVFGNKMEWILQSIVDAITAAEGFDLDVHVVHYASIDNFSRNFINKGKRLVDD